MGSWSAADIPSQEGHTVVATGADSGIGPAAAREPARAGAHVVLAVGSSSVSHDREVASALWERAADLTGVHPDVAAPSS